MAALIASVAAGSPDSNGFDTATIDTTGADLMVIIASYVSEPTIVDSKSNTWTPLTAHVVSGFGARMYYCRGGTVGSGHFFSANGPGHFASITVLAFSGSLATPFDQENGVVATAVTTVQPGSVTPTQASELVIAGLGIKTDAISATIDSGFTLGQAVLGSSGSPQHRGVTCGWLQQGGAGAVNPTFTLSGSSDAAAIIATFKATASASTGNMFEVF